MSPQSREFAPNISRRRRQRHFSAYYWTWTTILFTVCLLAVFSALARNLWIIWKWPKINEDHAANTTITITSTDEDYYSIRIKKQQQTPTVVFSKEEELALSSVASTSSNSSSSSSSSNWTIDILSIGSNTRPHYQKMQRRTFGTHPAVRHFWSITESHDSEADCHTNLTTEQVHAIRYVCSKRKRKHLETLNWFGRLFASPQYLQRKGNAAGWLCAQKRPMDGLQMVFSQYYSAASTNTGTSLPDYLFLIDDDTYVNLPAVLDYLLKQNQEYYSYGADNARIIAGCLSRVRWMNFSFPYGGWGTFFSRASLERWKQPLYCNATTTATATTTFEAHACWRLQRNEIGEGDLFVNGMTLMDLLYKYKTNQPYLDYENWNEAGFCLHSDTAIAYFANYYHLSAHATSIPGMGHPRFANKGNFWYDEDRLLGYRGSVRFAGRQIPGARKQRKECAHTNNTFCNASAHLCHYVTPDRMQFLHDSSAAAASSVAVAAADDDG